MQLTIICIDCHFAFSITSFEVTDVFSGDMANLLFFSAISGTLMPRVFSDPELLIGKQGVSFSGIIKGPVRGLYVWE